MTVVRLQRVIISVADRERSLALYRDVLGLTEKYGQGDMVMLSVPDGHVLCLVAPVAG